MLTNVSKQNDLDIQDVEMKKKAETATFASNPMEKPPITVQHLFNDSYVLHKRTI